MLKRALAITVSAVFFAATTTVVVSPRLAQAQPAAAAKDAKKDAKEQPKKELTPQQQKMKDCAAKWGDEKKAKKVSGRKAYNEFMSKCLKG